MNRCRQALSLVSAIAFSILASCGGGGGGGGGGAPQPDLSGSISVFGAPDSVFEAEPNDDVGQAHFLGSFSAGSGLTVYGASAQATDQIDAFRIEAPERVTFDVSLAFDDPGTNDLDLLVFDTVGGQFVEGFVSTDTPEVGTFHAKGSFLLVVFAYAGSSTYTMQIDASAPADPIAEREPNDDHGQAQYMGELLVGDSFTLRGTAGAAGDPTERLLFACPESIDLAASLAHPGAANFDLIVYDATTNLFNPTELDRFDTLSNPEVADVQDIPAMSLIEIEVFAGTGAGVWDLAVSASAAAAPDAGFGSLSPLAGTRAPLGAESAWLRGRVLARPLATVDLPAVRGEAIVRPRAGVDLSGRLARRGARELLRTPNGPVRVAIGLPAGLTDEEEARYTLAWIHSMDARDEALYCEPNHVYRAHRSLIDEPDDPFYNLQWHYQLIQLPAAWEVSKGANTVIVSVIDTGETQHPDLAARQIAGYDLISDATNAADGDGTDADPTDEGDGNGGTPSSFHGTHVAGTIGAVTDNQEGVAGVNWLGRIMHVRALGKEGGTVFDIANAVLFSAGLANSSGALPAEAAHVINMSLGGPGFSQTMFDAITDARAEGTVIFAAAGNENSSTPSYPAAYDGVISVSAVDFEGNRAPYSNFHSTVDIAAPGGDVSADLNGDGYPDGVLSTLVDDSGAQDEFVFAFYQGTSMACPHAAGVAALMLAVEPALTPNQIENMLESTAVDRGAAGKDDVYGNGLINAAAAVNLAAGGGSTTPILGLGTEEASFEAGDTEREVTVFNIGGGLLEVDDPTVTTETGGSWLSAVRVPSANPTTSDTDAIHVTVNRTGLANGLYAGSVSVTSNGGAVQIAVSLLVEPGGTAENVDIFVLVLDAETFETAAEAVVNPTSTLDYSFTDLPAGDYLLFAGSDDNDDGIVCGEGDVYCGAWPSLNEPSVLTVTDGGVLADVDFAVTSGFTGQSDATREGFRRL